jgi:Arc/MetJ family transcription regulator
MPAHLNITMDEALYARLKEELPAKGISAFIEQAVRAKLRPGREQLDREYAAATKEAWRQGVSEDWAATDGEAWPE